MTMLKKKMIIKGKQRKSLEKTYVLYFRKSRNLSEKKRRDQFNALVNELNILISVNNKKMDKSSILKSTISFLKHHKGKYANISSFIYNYNFPVCRSN